MKRVMILVAAFVALLSLSGCSLYRGWQDIKFTTPTGKTDQQKEQAAAECIKKLDNPGLGFATGAVYYVTKKRYEYQDCMRDAGFPCSEDCPYDPAKYPVKQ